MNLKNKDDFQLVDMSLKGKEDAMEEIVNRYQKMVFSIAYKFVNDYDNAKECVQEIFINVFNNLKSFKKKSSFKTWLYRVSINTSITFYKKALKRKKIISIADVYDKSDSGSDIEFEPSDNKSIPYKELAEQERLSLLREKIDEVKEIYRIPLILRDIEGFSYEEIANFLNVDLGTVKSRISRGREILRSKLIRTGDF